MRETVVTFFILLLLTLYGCQGKRGPVSEESVESDSSAIAQEPEMSDTNKSVVTPFPFWKYSEDEEEEQYNKYKKQHSQNPLHHAYYEICLESDTTDNVLRKISRAGGFENDEHQYPSILFTLCLERDFCNGQVFKSMEKIIATTFINDCSYWESKSTLNAIRTNNMPHNANGIFRVVERITQYINNDKEGMSRLRECSLNASVKMVCRRAYETPDYITFGLYSFVDYHGSCGNNTRIEYYTLDKRSGHVLSTSDLLKVYSKEQLNRKLLEQYKSVAYYINEYTDSVDYVSRADGCAILEAGLLFYYLPYNLGSGSEGQYNLVIQP